MVKLVPVLSGFGRDFKGFGAFMARKKGSEALEKALTAASGLQLWASKAWRIGVLMAKGAYLLDERNRLLHQLGEEALLRVKRGDWKGQEIEPLIQQLERINKKIEIEESLIRNLRFGTRGKYSATEATTESVPDDGGAKT